MSAGYGLPAGYTARSRTPRKEQRSARLCVQTVRLPARTAYPLSQVSGAAQGTGHVRASWADVFTPQTPQV